MSIEIPKNITNIFQRHAMQTGVTALVLQIQELGMAVSLCGRHRIDVLYSGDAHYLSVNIHERRVDPNEDEEWLLLRRLGASLPYETRAADTALEDLADIVDTLNHYLARGPRS